MKRRRLASPLSFAALLAASLLVSAEGPAWAQGASNAAAAQELFERGRELMEKGDYAAACPKLASSNQLDPAAGTQLNLASCYEKNGQIASAWVTYKDAAAAAAAAGRADWAAKAKARAAALEPSLSRLTIVLPSSGAASVRRDGAPLSGGEAGVALPIDPGSHTVEAASPGKKPWKTTVEVAKGAKVTVEVPALEDEPAEPAAPPPTAPPPAPKKPPEPPPDEGNAQRVAGVAVAGLGVAGAALGTALGLRAKSKHDEALESYCRSSTVCTQKGADLVDQAKSSATISTVAFAVGAAALAGGAVLYFTAPGGSNGPVRLGVAAGPGAGALSLGGAF